MEWMLLDELAVPRSATAQMAADVAMLDTVTVTGIPMLRLYRWDPPALTLGRHQDSNDVDAARCAARGVDVARRPTGGHALLHGADLTYAVAMPLPAGMDSVMERYEHIARGLAAGLARVGVSAEVAQRSGGPGVACFASHEGADLAVAGRKICGSAQVARRGALLQHGAVLLERMPFDETDLLVYRDDAQRRRESERLRTATVTLAELGVTADARTVADALIEGFEDALDASFTAATLAEPVNPGVPMDLHTPSGASA